MMGCKVLVTGGAGFLAINAAREFSKLGCEVYGIGHSNKYVDLSFYDKWFEATVSFDELKKIGVEFDLILHCGGGSSVGAAQSDTFADFKKTVVGTAELLEYVRKLNKKVHVIYPSSPAVHGQHSNSPINEDAEIKPASVYGYHKNMAEEMLVYSSRFHNVRANIVRFYSIYGPGLRKQLLWDACQKLNSSDKAVFWGSGGETRDWIYIDDAVSLIIKLFDLPNSPLVINGGSGAAYTVKESVMLLKSLSGSDSEVVFNGFEKEGDPKYYLAGQDKLKKLGWAPRVSVAEGFSSYVEWFNKVHD